MNNNSCLPKDEIDKILGDTFFTIYSLNYHINPDNYKEPFAPTLYNDFLLISNQAFTSAMVSLYHIEISTDVGVLFEDIDLNKKFAVDNLKVSGLPFVGNKGLFFNLTFQLRNYKIVITRSYIKLQEIMAQIGGIYNLLFIIANIMFYYTKDFEYYRKLIMDIYGYECDYFLDNLKKNSIVEKDIQNLQHNNHINIRKSNITKLNNNENKVIKFKISDENIPNKENLKIEIDENNYDNSKIEIARKKASKDIEILNLNKNENNNSDIAKTENEKRSFFNLLNSLFICFNFCSSDKAKRMEFFKSNINDKISVENLINLQINLRKMQFILFSKEELALMDTIKENDLNFVLDNENFNEKDNNNKNLNFSQKILFLRFINNSFNNPFVQTNGLMSNLQFNENSSSEIVKKIQSIKDSIHN